MRNDMTISMSAFATVHDYERQTTTTRRILFVSAAGFDMGDQQRTRIGTGISMQV